jgi:apolipoprotein N-acyltransferase
MRGSFLRVAVAAASGLFWAAAYPPLEITPLAWVALVPFFVAVRESGWLSAFLAGLAMWMCFFAAHLGWGLGVGGFHLANFVLGAAALGLGFGMLGVALAALARRAPRWVAVSFAAAWVCGEKLRLELGFASAPWGLLGDSQYRFLPLIQLAAWTGNLGLSFLVAWMNAALADALFRWRAAHAVRPPAVARLGTALAALAAVVASGALVLARDPPRETLRVALLQAGVYTFGADPPEQRLEVWQRYVRLTQEAAVEKPVLVAWPSSSVPSLIPADHSMLRELGALARASGAYLLVGSAGQEKSRPGERKSAMANSAFLISPQGQVTGRYDKIRLLPFNEYVPLRGLVRWPRWISGDVVDELSGKERSVFHAGSARFGVLICWENLFGDDFRASAARGVDFMVSMTNEAFTRSEAAHRQMQAMIVLRAVENGVSIVRPATTGLSFVVDPRGRILTQLRDAEGRELGAIAAGVAEVPLASERSFYSHAGDWFVVVAAALLTLVLPRRASRA